MTDDLLYARATCSALIITCSDFRFKTVERAFAETAALADDYDLIARPGSIRSLVAPRNDADRGSMEEEITLLSKLHAFTRILILNHIGCRAYDDLVDAGNEREIHLAHLASAATTIERRLEGVTAERYLIALIDGDLRAERQNDRVLDVR